MSVIYGLHEPMPKDVMPSGWIVHLAEVGHNADPHPGIDFSEWEKYDNICRIQYGWDNAGTIPPPEHLDSYVARVRSLVENSRGCHRWIIGNEPNLPVEWPSGVPIEPAYYAVVYNACYKAIHSLADHEVILAPIAPWNDQSGRGWIAYFKTMIRFCLQINSFALHTYTHGHNPALITSEAKMSPPYEHLHFEFRTYRDWLAAIPSEYQDRPVYITETNQDGEWYDLRNTWVQEAYHEIDNWNKSGGQSIYCLCLYRWPKYDKYHIEDKLNVQLDFVMAQEYGYSVGDDGVTVIQNPGFEDNFRPVGGDGRKTVGENWFPSWDDSYGPQPEYRPEQTDIGQGRVFEGQFAQKWFTTFDRHRAWVYQEIDSLNPGDVYRFTAKVWVWSSDTNEDGSSSDPPTGKVWVRVGVNPWGDANGMAPSTQYGLTYLDQYDKWLELEVIFRAIRSDAVVFLWSQADHRVKHNDVYWDDAQIELLEGGTTPPPVEPGECPTLDEIRDMVREEMMRLSGKWVVE